MTPAEYLDQCKAKMGIESDYELSRRLEIHRGWLPDIRRGKRHMPLDTAYRIAITLELDPAEVVADLESQREKNAKRAEFWRSFTSRARTAAAVLLCTLAWSFSATFADVQDAATGGLRRRWKCA